MTTEDLSARVLELLVSVAPDVDPDAVRPDEAFRDQFDFDSMDTLNFAIALHGAFGVDVPETDYAELASLAKCVRYLERRGVGSERHE